MSQTNRQGAGNGVQFFATQTALVIDASVERHILNRRAIRETGLFSLILSAESTETAQEILGDAQTPELALILVDHALADLVDPMLSDVQFSRSALVSDVNLDQVDRPVLVGPVGPNDIEALLEKLS